MIKITVNLDRNTYDISGEPEFYYSDIYINILGKKARENTESIKLDVNLLFNNNVVGTYNLNDFRIISRWNGLVLSGFFNDLIPGEKYVVSSTASIDEDFEFSFEFETPLPPQPYLSWTWDDSLLAWIPPFEKPDDGFEYDWDEENTSWELVVTES